ncbi:ATP-dependent RNA helicase DHX8 [Eremomyces bilateralis CBS 781.70]|uniref:ATP-dependent RNA helicase DHX8 n=1 Tax=Eremomyces bilateralis CBS 781.70 TaxID=1392243 RepID=A0A6G1G015_9PEZI|nr:ATP-dependent RNA helicase DHX8 [Eremomyces bilateralis CBS 781.70]KAF1811271.1 ATP-dependent RNA helicase DHX8 [Eremomyces bilateralis CBS 781.70]
MTQSSVPYRQIRGQYNDEGIIVYQAYNEAIAKAAVEKQRLDASPQFVMGRMTWIKPSWCWMMYRSGYSYKDKNQSNILAIKLTHEGFKSLLSRAITGHGNGGTKGKVRVQWDPERNVRIERLEHRSIQIGIPGELREEWIGKWTISIEDATGRAREMKKVLDDEEECRVSEEDLIAKGLMPVEKAYEVEDEELGALLRMIDPKSPLEQGDLIKSN